MQTKIKNCCTNTSRVIARYNCSSVTSSFITAMNGSRLTITRIFVCKCQYLNVTFAKKNPKWHKNGLETQNQEESANSKQCNIRPSKYLQHHQQCWCKILWTGVDLLLLTYGIFLLIDFLFQISLIFGKVLWKVELSVDLLFTFHINFFFI